MWFLVGFTYLIILQAVLWEWTKTPSVLVISYAMYSGLTYQSSTCDEKSQIRKLLQVRPNILILDEGHYVRNKDSIIRRQLMTVKTPLRIMLSGMFQLSFCRYCWCVFEQILPFRKAISLVITSCHCNVSWMCSLGCDLLLDVMILIRITFFKELGAVFAGIRSIFFACDSSVWHLRGCSSFHLTPCCCL